MMSPHANHMMESSHKPLPPPPTPIDIPNTSAIPTTSPSTTPSPRIRRKPLPSSAFSPRSAISSPLSSYSAKLSPTRATAPDSGTALNNIIGSPPIRRDSLRFQAVDPEPLPPLPPLPPLSSSGVLQRSPGEISITDFPLPPRREVAQQPRINEDIRLSAIQEVNMVSKSGERPPPLRIESLKTLKVTDAKKPQSPGSVFSAFFGRKPTPSPNSASSGVESSATDISDSQSPSPYLGSIEETSYFAQQRQPLPNLQRQFSFQSTHSSVSYGLPQRTNSGTSGSIGPSSSDLAARCSMLESELTELSRELAGSIRRELDLEDLVEKLQAEAPPAQMSVDRTSDYFSDSGTSSLRNPGSEYSSKEEIDKIKRDSEQQRAQLKIDLTQRWQSEIAQRKQLESHLQILEKKLTQTRHTTNDTSDASARIRELEQSLDDSKRRLVEERQTKENFEDLLTALKVELEQHRNERDNLRDEIVPNLKSQIDGLESSFGDSQKQAYDFARMQQEIQSLRDENAAISSARKMEQELIRNGMQFVPEGSLQSSPRSSLVVPKSTGLQRSSTVSSRGPALGSGLSHSDSLSRPNSILHRAPDTPDILNDKLSAVEQQRDALHSAVRYLRSRYDHSTSTYEKRIRVLNLQIEKLTNVSNDKRRGGYEREVVTLRQEINLLRKRADDALDQKWQCEKGLSGLKMDLDRSKQETASLQRLLQARNSDDPEILSKALENAMEDLQYAQACNQETVSSLGHEQVMATQLQESAKRAEALAIQVRQQLESNASLRTRLMTAVVKGEQNQQASATQISDLQIKLRKLEDTITTTQLQSETSVTKHEEEVRALKASHNAQLMRAKAGIKSPITGVYQPLSPVFASRSPRLENTTSGPGMALNQATKTEVLENKVNELEKALRDAEKEMEEVVGRMNKAQIEVFELQQERDEEHKRTRKLETEVKAERDRFQALVNSSTT